MPALGLIVAAPASGNGKTVVTLALARAYRNAGLRVAAAKTGPDYIDPAYLAAARRGDCADSRGDALPPAGLVAGNTAGSFIHLIDCAS